MGLEFIFLILGIGITGWIGFSILRPDGFNDQPVNFSASLQQCLEIFLAGFGVCSILLFLLAVVGFFHKSTILIVFAPLIVFYVLFPGRKKTKSTILNFARYLIFCLCFASVIFGLGKISKSYEAIIGRDDASVYIGTALQLVRSGSLSYNDPLALGMSTAERRAFFHGPEGSFVRFPGGVYFADLSKALVSFDRFHLFPTWLAFGIIFLRLGNFLYLLTFFSAISLICLYFIGKKLSGNLLAIALTSVFCFFYPQFYYSHLPMSELLTQSLFLAGLLIFIPGTSDSILPTAGQQRFVGILWGATFLCRIEMLFFLPLSLILAFSVIPFFAKQLYKWRTLIGYLTIFLLLAFYRQLTTGAYLVVWGLSGQSIMNQVWMPIASRLSAFVHDHPIPGMVLFIAASGLIIVFIQVLFAKERRWMRRRFLGAVGIFVTAFIVFLLLRGYFTWERFVLHLGWFAVYTSAAGLIGIAVGIVASLAIHRESNKSSLLWLVFIFCAVPAFFYLIRPLVDPSQPSFARRFVPVVYPCMFLLSSFGWLDFLKRALGKWSPAPQIAFSIVAVISLYFFSERLSYLIRQPLFSDTISQAERIANRIPENALVLIPDSSKVFHMEIPIHYVMNRDTIALPPDEGYDPVIHSYLENQLKKGRSILFLSNPNDPVDRSLRDFDLASEFTDNLSFASVGDFPVTTFPDHTDFTQLRYSGLRLQPPAPPAVKAEMSFNDPDVEFLNFNWPERQFRWTRDESELRRFIYQTNQGRIFLIVSVADQFLPYKGKDLKLSLLVNEKFPANFVEQRSGDFVFNLDCRQIPTITSVIIRSNSFVPKKLKINSDPRTLGITFVKLRFVRENE